MVEAKAIFTLDGEDLTIQCNENDIMKDICQKYSNKIIDILSLMLKFDENERPNFIELVRYLAKNNEYTPRADMTLIQYLEQ